MTADDILWTAFRYVHGELDADEALAFELALETDQAAREAVARAVELGEAVRAAARADAALGGPAGSQADVVALAGAARRAWTTAGWVVAAAAASIALAVWLDPGRMAQGPMPQAHSSPRAVSPEADESGDTGRLLAQAWVDVTAEFARERSAAGDLAEPAEGRAAGAPLDADPAAEYSDPMGLEPVYRSDDGSELPAPDWLVLAVADSPAGSTLSEVPSSTEVP